MHFVFSVKKNCVCVYIHFDVIVLNDLARRNVKKAAPKNIEHFIVYIGVDCTNYSLINVAICSMGKKVFNFLFQNIKQ